jgi:DNA-entry nuclease
MGKFRKCRRRLNLTNWIIGGCLIASGVYFVPRYEDTLKSEIKKVFGEQDTTISTNDSTYPSFNGQAYDVINNNEPDFTEVSSEPYFETSELDSLGRCGEAKALVGLDTLSSEERGSIGMIKPSGWQTVRYDDYISDKYLYNRGHLIMFAMYGNETNIAENLITETRYANSVTQLNFEKEVVEYIENTGKHVEYHVKPIFFDNELVARGIEIQALSEDGEFKLHVYVHNVQPNIEIDYKTGDSCVNETVQVN